MERHKDYSCFQWHVTYLWMAGEGVTLTRSPSGGSGSCSTLRWMSSSQASRSCDFLLYWYHCGAMARAFLFLSTRRSCTKMNVHFKGSLFRLLHYLSFVWTFFRELIQSQIGSELAWSRNLDCKTQKHIMEVQYTIVWAGVLSAKKGDWLWRMSMKDYWNMQD